MDQALTTTAFTLEGYGIKTNLGVVRGITVRSRSIFGTIGITEVLCYGTAVVVEPA